MKSLLLLSFTIIFAFPAYAQEGHEQPVSVIDLEFTGWDRVTELSKEQCPQSTDEKPIPPSMALEKHECWAKLVVENVGPVVAVPELLMKHLTEAKQIAIDYKKGRIDRDDANLAQEKLWTVYYTALVNHVRNEIVCAQAHDQPI